MSLAICGDFHRAPRCRRVAMLRGQEAVRADHRLRTDEKAIRAQSTISYKTAAPSSLLTITAFSAWIYFIRAEDAVGAHRAQFRQWYATVFERQNPTSPAMLFANEPPDAARL